MTTRTLFVYNPTYNEVNAVFPDDRRGKFMGCYAHVGQHCECSIDWILENNVQSKGGSEKTALKRELEQIGYTIDEMKYSEFVREFTS